MQQIANILFTISGTLWAIELLPQLIRTYKTKKVEDISLFFPLICMISFCCFMIGNLLIKNWILIQAHALPFVANLIFLIMVIIYRRKK